MSREGDPRGGTSNRGGRLLEEAEAAKPLEWIGELARPGGGGVWQMERPPRVAGPPAGLRPDAGIASPSLPGHGIGTPTPLAGSVGIALQNAAAYMVLNDPADLALRRLEAECPLAELEKV